ncbi:S-adenosyl-l-methionine hydroxide adenosyltransferase family protein [Candidatus Bathyarchaeota archaeon]|nr:S-adenosyl-l-methionine hydroxide adenosyltransferase family protein [Candidatus Bathyarchaeota archaeon]
MTVIALLTDFGLKDPYVSEMKGVILSINENAKIIDITHEIEKYNVRLGAFILASTAKFFPKNTIYVAVVDPGVGGERKALLIDAKGDFFIGPDNGLLILAAKEKGITNVYHLSKTKYFRKEISSTFHGRDIFAPVAAYLSLGVSPEKFGELIVDYEKPSFIEAEIKKGKILSEIIYIDSFGNIITNVSSTHLKKINLSLGDWINLKVKNRKYKIKFSKSYSSVKKNELLALIGSHGFLELAVNLGDAAKKLKVKEGDKVALEKS